jgi:dihydrofolate reductase
MRKIVVGAQVSMDGVMQAPGLPTEDPTNGFRLGGWVMPYADQEFGEEIGHLFHAPFDLLLGRKTYEIFAAYWPYYDEGAPHGSIATLFKGSGSTWSRDRVTSRPAGRARCCCATSPTSAG